MFEMFLISCNAGLQSLAPFADCTVDQTLIKTIPFFLDALAQLFHVLDLALVNAVVQDPAVWGTPIRRSPQGLSQDCCAAIVWAE